MCNNRLSLARELGFRVAEYPSHHITSQGCLFLPRELGFSVTEDYHTQGVIGHNCILALLTIVQLGGHESTFFLLRSLISGLLSYISGNSTLDY